MIGKPIALIQVPNQRLFGMKAAAQYLGVHPDTLRKYADLGWIKARRLESRRVFTLEDSNAFIDALPDYQSYVVHEIAWDSNGEKCCHLAISYGPLCGFCLFWLPG